MIFTVPMELLAVVGLERDSEEITRELLRQGALDFVSVREMGRDWRTQPDQVTPKVSLARSVELRKRLEGFLALADPPLSFPDLQGRELSTIDLDEAERGLDAVAREIEALRDRQKSFQEEIVKLEEIRRQVELFEGLGDGSTGRSPYSFLAIRTGTVDATRLEPLGAALEGLPSVLVPAPSGDSPRLGILLVTMRRDESRVSPILLQAGWEDVTLSRDMTENRGEAIRGLAGKIDRLRSLQEEAGAGLGKLLGERAVELCSLWARLRINELHAGVQSHFARTRRSILFSGWIPRERKAEVEAGIRKATRDHCHLEWLAPYEGEASGMAVPVEMRNPQVLKPFEMLVRNYAIPEYGTIDPTPFVAVAYLIMFGLMFGDAGHGLVLAVGGLAGWLRERKRGRPGYLFSLVTYCSAAAIVSGILFGAFFGFPLFPPLWFDYHGIVSGQAEAPGGAISSIYDILGLTVKFGMAVIALGLLLNWVNLVRKKRWLELILDKGGLVGGWIYGAGAWVAFGFVASGYRVLPSATTLLFLLGIPTLALAAKGPLAHRAGARGPQGHDVHGHGAEGHAPGRSPSPLDYFMEWIVEVLEIYSGYLANTLSFMRVAGLGIAHVSLMMAFREIARMIDPVGPFSPGAVAILVLGNVLVIALEGLSAGIQSLRLNYYEFFSKYFNGSGKAYNPISLRR